jgi:predicted membrane protein
MTSGGCSGGATMRLAVGLTVMLLGLLLTLDNFGLVETGRFLRLWPVLLIALGLAQVYSSFKTGTHPGAYFLTLIGVALLLVNLGFLAFRAAFALFLLGVGVTIVWHALRSRGTVPSDAPDASRQFDLFAMMGGIQRVLGAQDFRGGNATAILGGCDIDLRQASIQDGEAVINTFSFWGGIEIKVPEDWAVETQGMALLGGFDDTSRRPQDSGKKLIVTGYAVMGGVSIRN